ncbi:MAG TPA: DNA polymerase III subunit epsilon [Stellaceae bacterium]|nr:DNA polymerase III subunit epsilon [Stellaceae bacterium]
MLDTETTGLDPEDGHRIVEIACIELLNHVPTGRSFHRYVNPEREIPDDAFAVHGLSTEFLAQHPVFAAIAPDLLDFLGGDRIVAHNAEFDVKFVNAELRRLGRDPLRGAVEDTLVLARRRFPGAQASLDALCRRFNIDLAAREKHSATLDCELLAAVYLELIGGRQPGLDLAVDAALASAVNIVRVHRPARPHAATADEAAAHAAMLALLKQPIWLAGEA